MSASRDLIIVGAGPAGAAAALRARRDGHVPFLVAEERPGGLAAAARLIENLPWLPNPISGRGFQSLLRRRLDAAGIEYRKDAIRDVRRVDEGFAVTVGDGGAIGCRALILACGTEPAECPLSGLAAARESGRVHRDIRSLPDRLEGERVIVVGGGEAAVDSALWARDRGSRVALFARKNRLAVRPGLSEELERSSVEVGFGWEPVSIRVSSDGLTLEMTGSCGPRTIEGQHLLLCLGRRPRLDLLRRLGVGRGPDRVDTDIPGLFLAGDMLRERDRYIAPAIDDGIRAAVKAGGFLNALSRKRIP